MKIKIKRFSTHLQDTWHVLNLITNLGISKKEVNWSDPYGRLTRVWDAIKKKKPKWCIVNDFDDYYIKKVMKGRIPRHKTNCDEKDIGPVIPIKKKYYKLI